METNGPSPSASLQSYHSSPNGAQVDKGIKSTIKSVSENRVLSPNATAYYPLVDRGAVAFHPKIQEVRDTFSRLEGAGLVKAEEVGNLHVRFVGLKPENAPSPFVHRLEEGLLSQDVNRLINDTKESELKGSFYHAGFNVLTISEKQGEEIYQATPAGVSKTELLFLHEFGHAVHGKEVAKLATQATPGSVDLLDTMNERLENVLHALNEEAKGLKTIEADRYSDIKIQGYQRVIAEASQHPYDRAPTDGPPPAWLSNIQESYADAFEIVAVQALYGKEAALNVLQHEQSIRNKEFQEHCLTAQSEGSSIVEGHHTKFTLDALRDKISSGEVQAAIERGDARSLINEVVAEGVVGELKMLRSQELNPHYISSDGVKPGLPPYMSGDEFSSLTNFNGARMGALLIVPVDTLHQMNEKGISLYEAVTGVDKQGAFQTKILKLEQVTLPEKPLSVHEEPTGPHERSHYAFIPMSGTSLRVLTPDGSLTAIELNSGVQNTIDRFQAEAGGPPVRLEDLAQRRLDQEKANARNDAADNRQGTKEQSLEIEHD